MPNQLEKPMKKSLFQSTSFFWTMLITGPLPFIFFLFHFFFGMQKLEQAEQEMERIHLKTLHLKETQRKESALLFSLKNPDPHYLGKHLETLTFLLPEIKKLETLYAENVEDEQISKRLQFLKEGSNRLQFSEEQIRNHEVFRETEEKQQHPIEINEEDLKKLLCLIEGVTIWPYGPKDGRPQLIIRDFKLTKKELPNQEKVFVVSMHLLKRENLESIK
jgi:hypothetical protein